MRRHCTFFKLSITSGTRRLMAWQLSIALWKFVIQNRKLFHSRRTSCDSNFVITSYCTICCIWLNQKAPRSKRGREKRKHCEFFFGHIRSAARQLCDWGVFFSTKELYCAWGTTTTTTTTTDEKKNRVCVENLLYIPKMRRVNNCEDGEMLLCTIVFFSSFVTIFPLQTTRECVEN